MKLLAPTFAALLLAAPFAHAKLPPPSPEVAAKAAEAKAKADWASKVAAYKLCQRMDQVADNYRMNVKASGAQPKAPVDAASCADPGPFMAAEAKPIEAAGAHSPAQTSGTPPNVTPATQTQIQGRSQ